MAGQRIQRRLAAILAADVVGYSRLMGEAEAATLAALKDHLAMVINPAIAEHQGRIVKLMGDGVLAEFASVVDAVECAVAIQRGMAERNADIPEPRRITFRIGINLGDIIIDDDDIYGDGVNVAARLEGLAEPGGVCISDVVHQSVAGKLDLAFEDLGEQTVKNIAKPVRVYRIGAGAGTADRTRPASGAVDHPPLPDKPSIAVLPFNNFSGDPEQDAFADGMTEDLITDLSKVSGLFVVARNSSSVYQGRKVDVRSVAEELGVRYVLEGSVRKSGTRVRINAQLIDATTGGHLWAERYDGTVDDVFELQDEVGAKVVSALSVELTQSETESLERVHTHNLDAYELFVRAKATPYPPIPPRIKAAHEMFESVIDMAPEFAGGYAGAAAMIAFGSLFSHGDVSDAAAQAEKMARHAIALDKTFAWSYTALGMSLLLQRKYDEAIAAARETIVRQPSDADGYAYLGLITAIAGNAADAAPLVEEAIRLNPRFFAGPYWNILGQVQALAGNDHAAVEALEQNIRQRGPVAPPAYCSRAVAYAACGDLEKAHEIAEEMKSGFPQFRLTGWNLVDLVRDDVARNRYRDYAIAAGVPD